MDKINEELLKLFKESARYNTYIYNQIPTIYDSWDNNYKIEYLYDKIPDNSILFVLPCYSSNRLDMNKGPLDVKLTIRYLYSYTSNKDKLEPIYKDKSYTVYVETQEGTLQKANKGDIIANRLAMFRFIKGDNDSVILINSPLYNSISLSTLTVTNQTRFYQTPTVIKEGLQEVPVTTNDDFNMALARLDKLESKIQFGELPPEEALIDMPNGTIYIQVEKGY